MRLRYWTAMFAAGGIAIGLSYLVDTPAEHVTALPDTAKTDQSGDNLIADDQNASVETDADFEKPTAAKDTETWSQVVGMGDSLSGLLAKAGLDTETSREVILAIGSEFDVRHLKPGHRLALELSDDGLPQTATLEIDDGSRIQATFGKAPTVQRLEPELVSVRHAGEATVNSSIFAALDGAGIPTRFATDLELILGETFDLRTQLAGGEHIRLMWREHHSGDRVVGDPTIDFAQLDLADGRYEILWPDDNSRRTTIFKDGELLQTFDQPIRGARLSSAFGLRMHPVHGTVRMHSGLDFATRQGAAVEATQRGTVLFMGKRSGYGTVVELDHGNGVQTLYAHLSAMNEKLEIGQQIEAGTPIGRAGSTGTSTAPHLHYEIRVDGTPVSPLADTHLHGSSSRARTKNSLSLVGEMQTELDRLLASRG
ncbi:M23 family metallopeptidase [Sulfitobacter pseudonitzschiae]|nr:M23 family metallopeptidase [Pseudosulfitobacter pseudonitzschiae]MBM1831541.1 M23 family metallopeptidase [Pseudosulfitobacter pseudonitzschiae]MBM1836406.1 M23 family metallopeptidase [Pseudosulfitobacter pseudonitzschiae]MBM1841253.1 M23 family metallopeptidase [Pseudosulfitobacter pseudonitzschiae]MBM1846120.1 M23 family metallopeptidase [Pseudosulfitobacter pseudonitzschiae]